MTLWRWGGKYWRGVNILTATEPPQIYTNWPRPCSLMLCVKARVNCRKRLFYWPRRGQNLSPRLAPRCLGMRAAVPMIKSRPNASKTGWRFLKKPNRATAKPPGCIYARCFSPIRAARAKAFIQKRWPRKTRNWPRPWTRRQWLWRSLMKS